MDERVNQWIAVVRRVTHIAMNNPVATAEQKWSAILYAVEQAPAGNDNFIVRLFRKEFLRRVIGLGHAEGFSEEFNERLYRLVPREVFLELRDEEENQNV